MEKLERRWRAGQQFICGGITWRVVEGHKDTRPGGAGVDLRLEFHQPERGWIPVRMEVGAMMADFFYENEDALYPPPRYRGGMFYMAFLRSATTAGWVKAAEILNRQKANRREAA